jgi:hypothetical protein
MSDLKFLKFEKFFLVPVAVLILSSCASDRKLQSASSAPEVQYFAGKIQVSSFDGKIPYGPPYDSTVRRIVNAQDGMIEECIIQKNRLFYTIISRTSVPLVYDAIDTDGSFSGKLTYTDPTLSSWSYDIQVVTPNKGTISGSLPDYGAVIDPSNKKMKIKKIWEKTTLITESYDPTGAGYYHDKLNAAKIANPELIVKENCK